MAEVKPFKQKKLIAGLVLAAFLPTSVSFSQSLSVGVKGGVPLLRGPESSACCLSTTSINLYTVGLVGEVRLPFRFAIEADGLLQRVHTGYSVFQSRTPLGTAGRISGYAWNFPLLLKYYPIRSRFRPYFDAGATIRHVGHLHGNGINYAFDSVRPRVVPTAVTIDSDPEKDYAVGITAGGGIAIKAGYFQISPEVRYTRWTDVFMQPTRNQVELLLGITFPDSK